MLVLCPFVMNGSLSAQLHLSSSATYNSYSTSGTHLVLPTLEFQSTSTYGKFIKREREYTTAPMYVANGTIKTAASSIKGGVLLGGSDSDTPAIIPVVSGVPDTPIGEGIDVMLFLLFLCVVYVVCLVRKRSRVARK